MNYRVLQAVQITYSLKLSLLFANTDCCQPLLCQQQSSCAPQDSSNLGISSGFSSEFPGQFHQHTLGSAHGKNLSQSDKYNNEAKRTTQISLRKSSYETLRYLTRCSFRGFLNWVCSNFFASSICIFTSFFSFLIKSGTLGTLMVTGSFVETMWPYRKQMGLEMLSA